jgi:membrane protein YqaA with SNARE-associated domain
MIESLTVWMVEWATSPYGLLALFAIAVAESSFFPIPPDGLLIALCLASPETAFLYALVCAVGSVLGGALGYLIGLKGGRPLLKRWFKSEKVRLVEDYYHRWDVWAVGVAGFTPIPYKVFTISAGVFDLNFSRFILTSIVSRSARFFLVALLFYFFGETLRDLFEKYFALLTVAFFVLLFLGFYFIRIMGKRATAREGVQDET